MNFCNCRCQVKYFDTCFEKSKVRHLVDFFSTRCRTSDKNKIDKVSDLATSSRIRRVVMFDERVFDEKTCIGSNTCIVYKIIQSIISYEMHHTFMHAHTPNPQFMIVAETSTFGIFRGRNVSGRNVPADTC